jgi:hypothetical protein
MQLENNIKIPVTKTGYEWHPTGIDLCGIRKFNTR